MIYDETLVDHPPTLLQDLIDSALATEKSARIQIPKGDYSIFSLAIPIGASVRIFARDRVRLLYYGKRNRPMFILGEGAYLSLEGKIELLYNTNNVQEASKLIASNSRGSKFEILESVKISLFSYKPEQAK